MFIGVQIATLILVSFSMCERNFSSIRRIKNWLRLNILQQRFTDLILSI